MSIVRIRSWFYGLTKVETLMLMAILSISALLLFRIPEITHYKGIYFNESFQYFLVTIFGLICVLILRPPTISYFGWPRLKWMGAFTFLVAAAWAGAVMSDGFVIAQPLRVKIAGIIFILFIGLGEEMIARVLIFGSLQRFGTLFAVIASSVFFGLSHINVYLPDWDAWTAYWHVMSTTGFALFACALFIATRNYWVVAIFHALVDWGVVFEKMNTTGGEDYSPGILEGLWWGVEDFFMNFGFFGLFCLWILRGRWPNWSLRLAIKWKLVEQAEEIDSRSQLQVKGLGLEVPTPTRQLLSCLARFFIGDKKNSHSCNK
jgi:membrane protease YdiL (CAAX protease family)